MRVGSRSQAARCILQVTIRRLLLRDNLLVGCPEETKDNRLPIDPPREIEDRQAYREIIAAGAPFPSPEILTDTPQRAYERILADGGAVLPVRDSGDERLFEEIRTGTGSIIDSPEDVGGWPVSLSATPARDTDW